MSSSPHHWFVQTDFGALLGPMPDDALAEMARTGALLIRDQVREGTNGEWRLAGEVPGLFDEQTPALGLLSSTLEDLFAPETAAPKESVGSRNAHRQTPDKAASNSVASQSTGLDFETDGPLIAPPTAMEPAAVEQEFSFDFDATPVEPSIPIVAAPLESRPVQESLVPPSLKVAAKTEPAFATDIVLSSEPSKLQEPDLEPPASSTRRAQTVPPPRWQPPKKTSVRRSILGTQVWLSGSISVVGVLVLVTVWWFWPRQRNDIFQSYVAIYKEIQQRRKNARNQTDWNEFASRAKSQLDDTVPWLEERAKPGDREKSLLLYAGRDLQELIALPPGSPSLHQKRLDAFFEQLQTMYATK